MTSLLILSTIPTTIIQFQIEPMSLSFRAKKLHFASSGSMPLRLLGKTGVKLPILGFGTASAGQRLDLREAVRLYEQAFNEGVTYFDTAPEFAGYGKAQEQLGVFLRGRRSDVFLVTKCFEPDGAAALKLLEQNLKELQTDYADLVFVHSVGDNKMDPRVVFSKHGTYAALVKAKAQGLTRFIGLSGHSRPGRFAEAIKYFDVDVLLNSINFVDRFTYNFEEQVWAQAAGHNLGLIAMKVFGGELDPPPASLSHCKMPNNRLDEAFRYALSHPHVACAVIGMATHEELHQNLYRAKSFIPLSQSERYQLLSIGKQMAGRWGSHLGPVV
jgi:predicted aldo/keto reductase-like oxidoreductase